MTIIYLSLADLVSHYDQSFQPERTPSFMLSVAMFIEWTSHFTRVDIDSNSELASHCVDLMYTVCPNYPESHPFMRVIRFILSNFLPSFSIISYGFREHRWRFYFLFILKLLEIKITLCRWGYHDVCASVKLLITWESIRQARNNPSKR